VRDDARAFEGPKVEVTRVEDTTVDGAAGPLQARFYVPPDGRAASAGPRAADGLLMYFHGGGFVVGDLDTHDNVCRFLCRQAGVRVLAVEYRLAPEHRFPAAIDDAVAAFRFTAEHTSRFGASAERIGVCGDSAGGNLAAGVALAARTTDASGGSEAGAPALQVLFYPWLDLSTKRASYQLFRDGFYLTEDDLDWYRGHYLGAESDALDPRCSPALAEDVAGVAPAYIATAGFDPLRDEGQEYAERLRAAGVRVVLRRHDSLIHAFVNTSQLGHSAREALLEACGAIRFALAA
jgi:acetyl esterase